jgi:hypothetical protein
VSLTDFINWSSECLLVPRWVMSTCGGLLGMGWSLVAILGYQLRREQRP